VDLEGLLRATLDFLRTWVEGGGRLTRDRGVTIIRHEAYPLVHEANLAWVDALPGDGVEGLLARMDRAFGPAGVRHRYVLFSDAQEAFESQQAFVDLGFAPTAEVAMARLGLPVCITNPDVTIRQVGRGAPREDLLAVRRALEAELGLGAEEARQLEAWQSERSRRVGERAFVAYLRDEPAGAFTLWPRGPFALVGSVGTVPRFRMRGVGRTMIFDACRRAVDLSCEWALLTANAFDSPQLMYKTLGFQPVGEIRGFLRP